MPISQEQEEALFRAAIELPADKRLAFLDAVCAGDNALRTRLTALIAERDQSNSLPATPKTPLATIKLEFPPLQDEAIGGMIGPYKLLEKVGEGGFGVVYVAEQREPVKRRVALKIIKLGMDTRQVVARFEAERQALALMDHPNIAKVLDGGATATGRPYFAMELVRGVPITKYCDQEKIGTPDQIDLFVKVCRAIQHAHQKGIIHRDIKPSNILVTLHDGVPVPKVIDFGIAKATQQDLTDKTLYTQLQQFIGTPAYMSPEQAEMSGLDIDTRSDIYSLGVLLYELLTGSTPFDPRELMKEGVDGMRKAIREKEPMRPSTRVATLLGEERTTTAARHASEPIKLVSLLRGDLDWIVMKCLEKDRTRRYETANGVALDLLRHLGNEPVLARPPSVAYRLQKMVRRNKLAVAAGLAIAVVLLGGIIVSALLAVRATSAKVEALAAREQALDAEAAEKTLREQAQSRELEARLRAYASDLLNAKQAYDNKNLGSAVDLLNRQRPAPGQKDLRGWEWRYLWQQTRGDQLFTLCRKSGEISSLAVSKDGNWLGIGTYHWGGVSVWDLRTRQEIQSSIEQSARVQMEFSPASPVLAYSVPIGPYQAKLQFWDAARREMLARIPLDGFCLGLTFSDDGRYMATAAEVRSDSHFISMWQVSDQNKVNKVNSFPVALSLMGAGTGFAISADLRYAAYQATNRKLCLMDLHNGAQQWSVDAGGEYVTALAFSPDGKILALGTGFNKSAVRLWNVADGTALGEMEGHDSWVSALVFWPDGKKLASSSADQTIKIWDVVSRKCLDTLRGHRTEVWRLALLPDGKTLISGGKDGSVCFWDASISHTTSSSESIVTNLADWAFAQDNQSLVTLDMNGEVARRRGLDYGQREVLFETGASNLNVQMSQDGNWLVDGRGDKTYVWDVARRTLSQTWTNAAVRLRISRNGNKILSYSRSPFIFREFDASTRAEIQSWRPPDEFNLMVYSPDGSLCAFLTYEVGEVAVRNLETQISLDLKPDLVEASAGAFSPDGKLCVFTSDLGYAKVFDTAAWRQVATLGGFANGAHAAAFSLDGKRLAITSVGRQAVRIFETEGWQNVLDLEYNSSSLIQVAFSADGDTLAASSSSGDFHVWRTPSWEEINTAEAKEKNEAKLP